jgi:hypothetical protein
MMTSWFSSGFGRPDPSPQSEILNSIECCLSRRELDKKNNNCLIDYLRQCLGLMANCVAVREDLIGEFKDGMGHFL